MHVPERIVAVITNCCRASMHSLVPLYSPALGAILLISIIECGGIPDGLTKVPTNLFQIECKNGVYIPWLEKSGL
jgi:hypothetical protein